MSAFQGSMPGGQSRNGMPAPRPYRQRAHAADRLREAEVNSRLNAIRAEIQRRETGLPLDLAGETDIGPGPEWYREMAAEQEDLARPVPATLAVPAQIPAARCDDCGYQISAIGHKITCGAP